MRNTAKDKAHNPFVTFMKRHASNAVNEQQRVSNDADLFDNAIASPTSSSNQSDKPATDNIAYLSLSQYTQEELTEYREVFCMFDKVCEGGKWAKLVLQYAVCCWLKQTNKYNWDLFAPAHFGKHGLCIFAFQSSLGAAAWIC